LNASCSQRRPMSRPRPNKTRRPRCRRCGALVDGGAARSGANQTEQAVLGGETHVLLSALSAAEHHDRGDTTDAELASRQRGLVDVELAHLGFGAELARHLLDDWSQRATRSAPRRREIHQHRSVGFQDFLFEVDVVEHEDVVGGHVVCKITTESPRASGAFQPRQNPSKPSMKRTDPDAYAPPITHAERGPLPAPGPTAQWTARRVIEVLEPLVLPERLERLRGVLARRLSSVTVALDRPHDPHNGSAVLRSCDAFGVQTVHVLATAEPFVISHNVAQGTQRWVDVLTYQDAQSL